VAAWRWPVSLAFGGLTGWMLGGAILPALNGLAGAAGLPRTEGLSTGLLVLCLALQGAAAIALALLLARLPGGRRRLGWGCLALGGAIALNGVAVLLLTDVLAWLLGVGPGQDPSRTGGGGASDALFVLMLGLPYALLCAALLIAAAVLLRRPKTGGGAPG